MHKTSQKWGEKIFLGEKNTQSDKEAAHKANL